MNKILVAAAFAAVGAGGYYLYSENTATHSIDQDAVMAYIPADTAVFAGQFKPFPVKSYINSLPKSYKQYNSDLLKDLEGSDDPKIKFFLSLTKSYFSAIVDGETFTNTFGLADNVRSYFYALGVLPVFKVDINNADAIWALLDKAEKESGLAHVAGQLEGVNYRSYPLTNATDDEQVNLVVAVHNSILTLTIDASFTQAPLLETALGVKPAKRSIADAHIIEDIIAEHGVMDEGISYINHQALITGLTTTEGNQLARDVTTLFAMMGEAPFAELHTETCSQELSSIGANWPRTVAGYDKLDIEDDESVISYRTVIESNNKIMLDAYQKMRGYIPNYVQDIDNSVFNFALGIDVSQMVPSIQAIWEDLLTPEFQCEPLQQMQVQLGQQNPAMLGMVTGMANGVKGVGWSIIDYKINDKDSSLSLESLDTVMTVSAENPMTLFNMVKPFVSELANIQLPTDGSAVSVNGQLPYLSDMGLTAKIAVKGEHLVLFIGDKGEAAADKLSSEAVTSNGLFAMSLDYMKVYKPFASFLELSGETLPDELQAMEHNNTRMIVELDVDNKGVIIDTSLNIRNND